MNSRFYITLLSRIAEETALYLQSASSPQSSRLGAHGLPHWPDFLSVPLYNCYWFILKRLPPPSPNWFIRTGRLSNGYELKDRL